jgi:hypothetical protein
MFEVVFDSWLFDIHLVWKVFVNIPFHWGVCIPSFTFWEFWNVNIWNINNLNVHFILPSMAYLGHPHQVLYLRKGTWWGFGHEWNGTLEPFTWLKGSMTNSYTKRIHNSKSIHHWTKPKMQYLHKSLKIDIMTWNSHCNTHIMI